MMEKEINVLISTVSDSVEFVKEFKIAKEILKINGKIITSDLRDNVPAAFIGDKHIHLKPIDDDGYIDSIIEACNRENISIFIPRVDKELKKIAQNKIRIEESTSAKVMISDENVIDITRDKIKTYKFLIERGFNTPRVINDIDIERKDYDFPLYIKPVDGTSSKDNFKINNEEELNFFSKYISNPIIQEFVEGDEYCVDVLTDFNCNPIIIAPRLKIVIRDGNSIEGMIVKDEHIINEVKRLISELRPLGAINIDCIVSDDKVYIIEVNARFAEGVPISFNAGANYQLKLYQMLNGEKLEYEEEYEDRVFVARYSDFVVLNRE